MIMKIMIMPLLLKRNRPKIRRIKMTIRIMMMVRMNEIAKI